MEKEIRIPFNTSLDKMVKMLLTAKNRGESVFCRYNGVVFHSDTVTMDNAYIRMFGCTKAEHKKKWRNWNKKRYRDFYSR